MSGVDYRHEMIMKMEVLVLDVLIIDNTKEKRKKS